MKTIFSILSKILLVVFILIVILVIFRNPIAKAGAQIGTKIVLGLPLTVEKIDISLTKSYLLIKGLRVGNPPGFPEGETLHMPEFYVDYNFGELLRNKIHLEEIRVNIDHFTVSKNQTGIDSLQTITKQEGTQAGEVRKEAPTQKPTQPSVKPAIQVDKLSFKFGKVNYVNYSKNLDKPNVKEIKLNLNKNYKNLSNPYYILGTLTLEILAKSGLAGLTNIDLGFVRGFADDALVTSMQLANQATDQASKLLKDTTGQLGGLTGSAGETAQKATGAVTDVAKELAGSVKDLKDKLKLPFGKQE